MFAQRRKYAAATLNRLAEERASRLETEAAAKTRSRDLWDTPARPADAGAVFWQIGLGLPVIAMLMLLKAITSAALPEIVHRPDAVAWIAFSAVFSLIALGCGIAAVIKGAAEWGKLSGTMAGGTLAMGFILYLASGFC